jgi:hypothetical protein
MNARTHRWIIAAAIIGFVFGMALSHWIEPGVHLERVTLADDSLVGRYDFGKHGVLRVTREGSHLFAQFAARNCEIFPKSETEYVWKVMDAQVTPHQCHCLNGRPIQEFGQRRDHSFLSFFPS